MGCRMCGGCQKVHVSAVPNAGACYHRREAQSGYMALRGRRQAVQLVPIVVLRRSSCVL